MKILFFVYLCLLLISPVFSQSKLDFESVVLKTEQFPDLTKNAVILAAKRNLPTSIFIKDQAFMQPVIVEKNEIIYSVFTNLLHPIKNGYLATFNEIENNFNLKNAKIKYFGDRVESTNSNFKILAPGDSIYLIPESTNDRIMAFSAINGDTINLDFIFPHNTNDTLNLPIDALHHRIHNSLVVSDQVNDIVQEFDSVGIFQGTYAPTDTIIEILDNIRGMAFHPNTNLLVTVGSGINEDAIVEFDFFGKYKRNFIKPDDTIMNSPFDILPRINDVLVSAITSNGIHKYDINGIFMNDFATGIPFPEQITELSNGDIAVTNFSTPNSGIQIYPSSGGTYSQLLSNVTGNRGIAELSNGNLLTTNGTGAYIIDRTTGNIIKTIVDGVSARFISLYVVDDLLYVPIVKILSDSLKFGSVFFDSTKTKSLFIRNYGNSELVITNVYSNHNDISITPDTGNISMGDSMLFEVSFNAFSDSSTEEGYIVFQSNSPSSPDSISFVANLVTGLNRSESTLLQSFSLSQNYPNPFNPSTYFNFTLPTTENVEFIIYDVNGQIVETLLDNKLVAGNYKLKFNGKYLSSGVYIYKLKAGNFVQSHKMIFIK
jgi:DUF4097 and DUF4098 domain-containing protein YvlB